MKKLLTALSLLLCPLLVRAQFAVLGDDPASVRWNSISTRDYRVLYPTGADSLARTYAFQLQRWYAPVGATAGFAPNQNYCKPTPVILHAFSGVSNGAVVWAPRRMDLFTLPDAYGQVVPLPWEQVLAIHEARHVAQHQFARSGWYKALHYIFGETPAYFIGGFLPNAAILEGDAVVAETALTQSGRGRTADFLSYMRMSFDQGDFRNWYRWRYGSGKYYTPDYYKVGYMTVAGMRYLYDDPDFTADYLKRFKNPLRVTNLQSTVRRHSGERFRRTWTKIAEANRDIWRENDSLRGPLTSPLPLMESPRRFTSYAGAVPYGNGILAVASGLDRSSTLVYLNDKGKLKEIRPFSGGTSRLAVRGGRIYWSETIPHPRWTLQGDVRIRWMEPEIPGKIFDLTTRGRYFNPSFSEDGETLAVVEYPITEGARLVLLSPETGAILDQVAAPAGVQFTEPAVVGDRVYVAGVSEAGSGLYAYPIRDNRFAGPVEEALAPEPVKIKHLRADGDGLLFVCDRTTVGEVYRYADGQVTQLTATKYGVGNPYRISGGLLVSSLGKDGVLPAFLPPDSLRTEVVSFADRMSYPIADKLSAQEAARGVLPEAEPEISAPKRFGKFGHLFHVHSWLPGWYNTDELATRQYQQPYAEGLPGVTVLFQNLLSTASGSLGVSFPIDSADEETPLPALHARFHYNGWTPVFDFGLDYGGREAREYRVAVLRKMETETVDFKSVPRSPVYSRAKADTRTPIYYLRATLGVSLPFDFSRNGWERNLTPAVRFGLSNDLVCHVPYIYTYDKKIRDYIAQAPLVPGVQSSTDGFTDLSLTYSAKLPVATSQIFPRKGGGVVAGVMISPHMEGNGATLYGEGVAYLPGVTRDQGLRLSLSGQNRFSEGVLFYQNLPIELAPRGFARADLQFLFGTMVPRSLKATVDYAIPLLFVDSAILCPYVYIRNFELIPFLDAAWLSMPTAGRTAWYPGGKNVTLTSVGADLNVRVGKFFMVQNDLSIGIRAAYNGGSGFEDISHDGTGPVQRVFVGLNLRTVL